MFLPFLFLLSAGVSISQFVLEILCVNNIQFILERFPVNFYKNIYAD